MLTIRKWVRITPKEAVVNGVPIRINPTDDPLPVALYRQRVGNYPKFFKMDPLCRVGFVASELLLEGEPQRFEPREDRAVALFSHSGRVKEAYSLPQRSIPIIFPWGLRFAQAMVSAPLPQPMSSPTPPSGSVICSAVPSMICFESLRSPS